MERQLFGNSPERKDDPNSYNQGYYQEHYPQDGVNYGHDYYLYSNQNNLHHSPFAVNTQFSSFPVPESMGGSVSAPVQFSKAKPTFDINSFGSNDNIQRNYETCYQNSGIPNESELSQRQHSQEFGGEAAYSLSPNSGKYPASEENFKDSFPGYGFGKGYTMQSYSNKKTNSEREENSLLFGNLRKCQDEKFDSQEASDDLMQKMEKLSVKEPRGRRKSSTLDMFNDPVGFREQIDKDLENFPEDHNFQNSGDTINSEKESKTREMSLKEKLKSK